MPTRLRLTTCITTIAGCIRLARDASDGSRGYGSHFKLPMN